ncbi:hemerythrin domain-containing protein [Actinacidiphila sp. bgisy160]|uniref:hemerythrin domain-containing protein n=1 Tax=Actinacidiphila sp. bgisy160 TaxID=3413796 RepID=UPI003D70840C
MTEDASDSQAVTDTWRVHQVHRVATTLLAEAAVRPSVPIGALAQLRDFLVANLRHHHEAEDDELWPRIVAAASAAERGLAALSEEHKRLDAALDLLASVNLSGGQVADGAGEAAGAGLGDGAGADGVRAALRDAAAAVRDTVHDHLAHEEPLLFPALREHITPAQWQDFAQRVIATTPPVARDLMVGFLDEVGKPREVEPLLESLQATGDLRILRDTGA